MNLPNVCMLSSLRSSSSDLNGSGASRSSSSLSVPHLYLTSPLNKPKENKSFFYYLQWRPRLLLLLLFPLLFVFFLTQMLLCLQVLLFRGGLQHSSSNNTLVPRCQGDVWPLCHPHIPGQCDQEAQTLDSPVRLYTGVWGGKDAEPRNILVCVHRSARRRAIFGSRLPLGCKIDCYFQFQRFLRWRILWLLGWIPPF